jgi:hypothetical protein
MSHAHDYIVQLFIRGREGAAVASGTRQCASPEGARRLAERLVCEKKAVGALAYARPGAVSASEFSVPIFLARIGDVPEADVY